MPDLPRAHLPVVFASDVARQTSQGEFVLVGRLLGHTTECAFIADAYATVQVVGVITAAAGALVRLHVRPSEGALVLCAIVDTTAPAGDSTAEHRRLITQRVGLKLRARDQALRAVRSFFAAHEFVEVDTPLLVPSPGLDLHLDAVATSRGYLITSPEYQMKRLLVGGMPRIFQVSHVFRADELGPLHNPEFALLEWYRAFADVDTVMRDTEELVRDTVAALARGGELVVRGTRVDLDAPFARLRVSEAFARFAHVAEEQALTMAEEAPDQFFRTLVERVEPALARVAQPVFLTDYPISQASLARPNPRNPRVCERFELYIAGVELCNGFGELTDAAEQRRRLLHDQAERARLGKPVYPLDERFIAALAEGMPPSAGNALGLDRLIALCLGADDIASVMSFPEPLL